MEPRIDDWSRDRGCGPRRRTRDRGHVRASRLNVDGTTEVAALVVLTAGILAGSGAHRLASGTIALTCLLLGGAVLCRLNFPGYVARRLFGKNQGYLVGGLLGRLISSTNVTFTFARASRLEQASVRALAIGTVAANVVLYPRVLFAVAVLNTALLPLVARYFAVPALTAIAGLLFL